MDAWGSALALAAAQHHVLAVRQLAELGIDPWTFRRRARREGWTEHGATLWSPPGHELDDWGRVSAAALCAGTNALVTGRAGLWMHGLASPFPEPVRIVTPMRHHVPRRLDPQRVRVIASRTLRDGDATVARRVPAATVERCFLDLVVPPSPPVSQVRDRLLTAIQKDLATIAGVGARAEEARGLPGRGVLLRALADLGQADADSPFSHRVLRRVMRDGFRPDPSPVPVPTPGRTLHPDVTFACDRVCLECDGLRFHSSQRDVAIDDRKDRRYRDAGWRCLRIGWWEFERGWNGFTRDLRAALDHT